MKEETKIKIRAVVGILSIVLIVALIAGGICYRAGYDSGKQDEKGTSLLEPVHNHMYRLVIVAHSATSGQKQGYYDAGDTQYPGSVGKLVIFNKNTNRFSYVEVK